MSNKTHSSLEQQQQRLDKMRADRDKLKLKLANSTTGNNPHHCTHTGTLTRVPQ
jgi:hypothetical protein